MPEYQRQQIEVFVQGTDKYLMGEGYNVWQALISSAGGMTGRGYLSGTQSQLHFLLVRYADFIFAVVGEELRFVGSVVLVGLLIFLFMRGLEPRASPATISADYSASASSAPSPSRRS